jgi:acetoin utilization protein AcuB
MWMSKKPITVDEDTPIMEARKVMVDNNIRRLPVMRRGKLVGIVTHSDIQEASPSNATSLSIYELHYLISKVKVKEIMTKNPLTVSPDDTLEKAALIMHDHKVGGLPVVKDGELVGVITETDIFEAFVEVMGLKEKGTRLTFELEHKPGALETITRVVKSHNINILSLASCRTEDESKRMVVMRLRTDDARQVVEDLASLGIRVQSEE